MAAAAAAAAAVEEEEEAEVLEEYGGYKLHLSSNKCGYYGVSRRPSGRYQARLFPATAKAMNIGSYATAVEAAVAVAMHLEHET